MEMNISLAMKIKTIELNSFRNYDHIQCELDPQLNVFIGANGQGKTNLLESLAFLSSLRSFRQVSDSDLIQFDKDYARVSCILEDDIIDKKLSVMIHPSGKTLRYQNQLIRKTSEFIGLINTVIFSPIDMSFFEDAPRVRRKVFDLEAGKLSRLYLSQMLIFNKSLKQRNALLKEKNIDRTLLDILTKQLAKSQVEIILYRRQMVEFINSKINEIYERFSKVPLHISITYEETLPESTNLENDLIHLYQKSIDKDIFHKTTQKGLQRDDFVFKANDIEISKIASQGQKRLVLLAFKLTLVEYIVSLSKSYPILLLDDVFSELDEYHQKTLLKTLPKESQTIITTTQSQVLKEIKQPMTVFTITDGQITSRRTTHE